MNNYLNIHTLLIVIAIIVFVLAAINVPSRLHLVALGLAIFALAFLAGCGSTVDGYYQTPGSTRYGGTVHTASDYSK